MGGLSKAFVFLVVFLLAIDRCAGQPLQVGKPSDTSKKKVSGVDLYGDPLPPGAIARLGTLRFRHKGSALAISRDGKTLASGGQTGIRLFELPTGRRIKDIPVEKVLGLSYAKDGRLLVFAERDNQLVMLDAATNKTVRVLGGRQDIQGMIRPDDQLTLVPLLSDILPAINVKEIATSKTVRSVKLPENAMLLAPALSPDGKNLAAGASTESNAENGESDSIRVWDVATGKERLKLPLDQRSAYGLAFSPDGKRLVAASSTTLTDYFKHDNRRNDSVIETWDLSITKPKRQILKRYGPSASGIIFSRDGKSLAASTGEQIYWLDSETGAEQGPTAAHADKVRAMTFLPDGKTLVSVGDDDFVRYWEFPSGKQIRAIDLQRQVIDGTSLSADGKRLAWDDAEKQLHVMELSSGKEIWHGGKHSWGGKVFVTPNGEIVGEDSTHGEGMRFWNVATGKELSYLRNSSWSAVTSFPSSKVLVCSGFDGVGDVVRLTSLSTGRSRDLLKLGMNGIGELAVSPDGKVVATSHQDQSIQLWDAVTGKSRNWHVTDPDRIPNLSRACPIAFSPSGNLLACGGYQGTVTVWDTRSGREVCCFRGHESTVHAVLFSPDGDRLVSASIDTTMLVWETPAEYQKKAIAPIGPQVGIDALVPARPRQTSGGVQVSPAAVSSHYRHLRGEPGHAPAVLVGLWFLGDWQQIHQEQYPPQQFLVRLFDVKPILDDAGTPLADESRPAVMTELMGETIRNAEFRFDGQCGPYRLLVLDQPSVRAKTIRELKGKAEVSLVVPTPITFDLAKVSGKTLSHPLLKDLTIKARIRKKDHKVELVLPISHHRLLSWDVIRAGKIVVRQGEDRSGPAISRWYPDTDLSACSLRLTLAVPEETRTFSFEFKDIPIERPDKSDGGREGK